jgi:hypothetical protein
MVLDKDPDCAPLPTTPAEQPRTVLPLLNYATPQPRPYPPASAWAYVRDLVVIALLLEFVVLLIALMAGLARAW